MIQKVILRSERTTTDSRYLSASFNPDGDLVIEGQDIGDEVRRCFDCSEYEWIWTIRALSVVTLKHALGNPGDLLHCLQQKFSGNNAANIGSFLSEHGITYEAWSRTGD
jgi:hypothetical protein